MSHRETSKEVLGLTRITKKCILELCKKDKLYQTPELNDVLYLHYQGFDCIECLDDYTELKCLWLECNAISEIHGLNKQTKLKCLFLQSNLIRKIENLEYCKELDTLNLSQNHIWKIENCGFEVLPVLNTLNLASNYLKDSESLNELKNCKYLSVLDLSNNRIDDILVVKIFSQMPELKVLVLQGNPVVSKIPQYRKTLILECKKLTYLDSRPVFPKDRACAEAWKRGGYAEEQKENKRWNRKERKKIKDSVNATIHLRNKNRKREDQISFIPSSESEDDTKPQIKNIKVHLDSADEMANIWDEVSAIQSSNDCLISNNNNEDKNSEHDLLTNDMIMMDDKDCTLEMTEATLEAEKNFKKQEHFSEVTFKDFKEDKLPKITLNVFDDNKEFQELERNSSQLYLDRAEKNKSSDTNPDHNKNPYQNNATTIEAMEQITTTLDSNKYLSKQAIEVCDSTDGNIENKNELCQELEENIPALLTQNKNDLKSCQLEKMEVKPLREIENECSRANTQLQNDFDELSTSVSIVLSEELEAQQEDKKTPFCYEKSAKDINIECSDKQANDIKFESKLGCLIEPCDNATEMVKQKENLQKNPEVKPPKSIIDKNVTATLTNERLKNNLKMENDVKLAISPEIDDALNQKPNPLPIDITSLTHKSNEALLALEQESRVLKKLLQKLENSNEELFKDHNSKESSCKEFQSSQNFELYLTDKGQKVNSDNNCLQKDQTLKDSIKTKNAEAQQVVEEIFEECLNSLESILLKQNLHEGLQERSESNETLRQTADTSKTSSIPQVIESFNELFMKIEAKQNKHANTHLENADKNKSLIFKDLLHKSNIKQFNTDTIQSLNAQLDATRKKQHKKVSRMVDRVYAQKERYNDTIELSDNKLMVCNPVTKELQELPKPVRCATSDSEDGYDTALSDEAEPNKAKLNSFKPIARKSNEDIVVKALFENKHIFCQDESEESADEFYSLDDQDKINLYKIDKDLLKDLNFDFSNLAQQDASHITQCARSYGELKHCLTLNKAESCLTEQENKLLENVVKRNCKSLDAEETLQSNQQSTSQLEKSSEEIIATKYLSDFLERQKNKEFVDDTQKQETFCIAERQSEEEKNEIENNFDIENDESVNTRIFECKSYNETATNKLKELVEENREEETLEQSAKNSIETEFFECNLEIFSEFPNEATTDTITVNAELKF